MLALLAGAYLVLGHGSFGGTHTTAASLSTPAGPVSGTATTR
jgi:hypothetical protein